MLPLLLPTVVKYCKINTVRINGDLAQLVEQRPEEPCVPSSSLGVATKIIQQIRKSSRIYFLELFLLFASVILVRAW